MFLYPWGDFHSLNLGWFLLQFKDWTEKIQEYLDNGGGTSENLANVIAPVFNAENTYLTGDYVLYNDELYKATEPVPAGTWNPDAWERCLVTEEMGSGSGGVDNVARLMIAGQYSNTYNYQKYAICRYADKLWMCNTNLPTGGEEWVPSHWDEITVGAGLTGLRRSVETLSQAITDLQNIVGDGSLTGFTASDLTGAANELMGSLNAIGNLRFVSFDTTSITTQVNALGVGAFWGIVGSNTVGMPTIGAGVVSVLSYSTGQKRIYFYPNGSDDAEYMLEKRSSWRSWITLPTRAEVDEIRNAEIPTEVTISSVHENVTINSQKVYQTGRIVVVAINITISQDITTSAQLLYGFPAPIALTSFAAIANGDAHGCNIRSNRYLYNDGAITAGSWYINVTYITAS